MIATTKTSKSNGKATGLIPAAGYIRMSDHSQVESPKQQKPEIIKLAKQHDCKIVVWYQDDGITGDSIEERPQFCAMLADAVAGKFKVILCWDQDRFGRFDSITAGAVIHPLRKAGVSLTTIAQGAIDWNDFAGRLMYAIKQEGKYQYLVDLSRNVLRGQIASNKKGNWQGSPPLGYDRQYFDANGDKIAVVKHGEKFRAPEEWRCRLTPGDTTKVELMQWMFDEYALKETSISAVRNDLNARGIKSPAGGRWKPAVVQRMLMNPAYIGHTYFGRHSVGKYHRCGADGEITNVSAAGASKPDGTVRHENTHEAIIDPDIFALVQKKLARRSRKKSKVRANDYALTGRLICGHCGGNLCGSVTRNTRYYACSNSEGGCVHRHIPADAIEPFMIRMVCDRILSDANLERQRADILAEAKKRKPRRSTATKAIKASLAKLEVKIKKGTERLLLVDDDDAQDASLLLAEWREERVSLRAQLDAEGHSDGVRPLTPEEKASRVFDAGMALRKNLKNADPARLRYVFGETFSEVRLWWVERVPGRNGTGKQRRYLFSRGLAIISTRICTAAPPRADRSARQNCTNSGRPRRHRSRNPCT